MRFAVVKNSARTGKPALGWSCLPDMATRLLVSRVQKKAFTRGRNASSNDVVVEPCNHCGPRFFGAWPRVKQHPRWLALPLSSRSLSGTSQPG